MEQSYTAFGAGGGQLVRGWPIQNIWVIFVRQSVDDGQSSFFTSYMVLDETDTSPRRFCFQGSIFDLIPSCQARLQKPQSRSNNSSAILSFRVARDCLEQGYLQRTVSFFFFPSSSKLTSSFQFMKCVENIFEFSTQNWKTQVCFFYLLLVNIYLFFHYVV